MLSLQTAGVRIADDLDKVERLTNELLRATAQLQTSMMNACIDSELSPHDGQLPLARLQQAQSQIVDARGNFLRAHKSMREEFIKRTEVTAVPDTWVRCPTAQLQETTEAA